MTRRIRYTIKKSVLVLGLMLLAGGQAYGIGGMDTSFCRVPAFLEQSVSLDPDVLVLLDSSGSMNWEAYLTTSKYVGGGYPLNPGDSYYGIFEANQCYTYNYSNDWFESVGQTRADFSCDQAALPGTFSGTFLNLASGTRLEIIKKVFTGGLWYNGFLWGDPGGEFHYGCGIGGYNVDVPADFVPGGVAQRVSGVLRYTGAGRCDRYYTPTFYSSFTRKGASILHLHFNEAGGIKCDWKYTTTNNVRQPQCTGTTSNCITSKTESSCGACNPTIVPPGDSCTVTTGGWSYSCRRWSWWNHMECGGGSCVRRSGRKCPGTLSSPYNEKCLRRCRRARIKGGGSLASCNYSPAVCDCTTRAWQCVPTVGKTRDYYYRLRIKSPADPADGLIQQAYSQARWSVFTFDRGWRAQGAQYTTLMGDTKANTVKALREVVANTNTPLAESLYTSILYYRQDTKSPYRGTVDFPLDPDGPLDPLYDQNAGKAVGCRPLNILVLTDGEPTSDGDLIPAAIASADNDGIGARAYYSTVKSWWPPANHPEWKPGDWGSYKGDWYDDVAFWGHTADQRPDLAGTQTINIYSVYAFGTGDYARFLMWEAGTNGMFTDLNGNGKPDRSLPAEWDADKDGDPDGFFLAENGDQLKAKLTQVFGTILERSSSVSPVSYLGAAGTGQGIATQSFFNPRFVSVPGVETTWAGFLRSFWMDSAGLMRADTDPGSTPGQPGLNIPGDEVIEFRFDKKKKKTFADYYGPIDPLNVPPRIFTPPQPDPWAPLLKNTTEMSEVPGAYDFGLSLARQSPASRRIYTDLNGVKKDFSVANASQLGGALGVTTTIATQIINYIRGQDQPGLRSRTVINAKYGPLTWKLGDSIHSDAIFLGPPPAAVSFIPSGSEEALRQSYSTFVTAHANDPMIILIGANDGMVHAFGMGKVSGGVNSLKLLTDPDFPKGNDGSTLTQGDEVWGWIPSSALPHLNWLTEKKYCHVYTVDGRLKTYYMNAFNPDALHPNGWGRILTVSLELGCPAYKGFTPGWLFLDVTDLYNPKYMAFFTDQYVGTAFWEPVAVRYMDKGHLRNKFVLFGGPDDDLNIRRVGQNYMYVLDVPWKGDIRLGSSVVRKALPAPFDHAVLRAGGSVDFDETGLQKVIGEGKWPQSGTLQKADLISDMIYAGGYVGSGTGFDGYIMAIDLKTGHGMPFLKDPTTWRIRTLAKLPGMPVENMAFPYKGPVFNAGTGRLETTTDYSNLDQQAEVLVVDPCFDGETGKTATIDCSGFTIPNISNFVDETNFTLNATGATDCGGGFSPCTDLDIRKGILTRFGAKFLFSGKGERVHGNGAVLRGILYITTFSPVSTGSCSFGGTSNMYVLKMFPDGSAPAALYLKQTNVGTGNTTLGAIINGNVLVQDSVGVVRSIPAVPKFSGPYFGFGPLIIK